MQKNEDNKMIGFTIIKRFGHDDDDDEGVFPPTRERERERDLTRDAKRVVVVFT